MATDYESLIPERDRRPGHRRRRARSSRRRSGWSSLSSCSDECTGFSPADSFELTPEEIKERVARSRRSLIPARQAIVALEPLAGGGGSLSVRWMRMITQSAVWPPTTTVLPASPRAMTLMVSVSVFLTSRNRRPRRKTNAPMTASTIAQVGR